LNDKSLWESYVKVGSGLTQLVRSVSGKEKMAALDCRVNRSRVHSLTVRVGSPRPDKLVLWRRYDHKKGFDAAGSKFMRQDIAHRRQRHAE